MPVARLDRVRQYRERQRNGDIRIVVTLNEVLLVEALKLATCLDPNSADDAEAIRAGTEKMLKKISGEIQ